MVTSGSKLKWISSRYDYAVPITPEMGTKSDCAAPRTCLQGSMDMHASRSRQSRRSVCALLGLLVRLEASAGGGAVSPLIVAEAERWQCQLQQLSTIDSGESVLSGAVWSGESLAGATSRMMDAVVVCGGRRLRHNLKCGTASLPHSPSTPATTADDYTCLLRSDQPPRSYHCRSVLG